MDFKNLEIFVDGIRCFNQPTWIPIKPITILVGENSSGKSTILALVRIIWDIVLQGMDPNDAFNEAPFAFGSFDQIATYVSGAKANEREFKLGLRFSHDFRPLRKEAAKKFGTQRLQLVATFSEQDGVSRLSHFEYVIQTVERVTFEPSSDGKWNAKIEVLDGTESPKPRIYPLRDLPKAAGRYSVSMLLRAMDELAFLAGRQMRDATISKEGVPQLTERQLQVIERLWEVVRFRAYGGVRPYAFAPIRSSPRRTYDPVGESPSPEGSHVPSALAELSTRNPEKWALIQKELEEFGTASGLFEKIAVQHKGKKHGDPFQIGVAHRKRKPFNLADVGYGVSQVLPIAFELLVSDAKSFLLQQPEVHLHPRAQAALGSFLVSLNRGRKQQFVVETHSDHLVDRIRMDIRDHHPSMADDVVVLFFDGGKSGPTITPIIIGKDGELAGVPVNYREFFMQEQRRFLLGES
jgi:predicted ATPase